MEHFLQLLVIAVSCKNYRNGKAGRTGTNDSSPHTIRRCRTFCHFICVSSRNIAFDGGKMDRSSLASKNAMPLTLVFMVAYKAAYSG